MRKLFNYIVLCTTTALLTLGCTQSFFLEDNSTPTPPTPTPTPTPEPEPTTIPDNEIWYTSTDGNVVSPYATDVFGASIISNTYSNGKGIIKFSSNVTSIGTKAFYSCTNITSITIPNSVTEIGVRAFAGCDITSIKIPDSTTEIGEAAFAGSNLAKVIIPDSVTEIREGAFSNCDSLTSVTIGSGVTLIEASAFFACINLTEFNGKFASTDKRCLIVNGTLHSFAPYGLSKYTIPNSVTSVGDYAFDCCSNLTSITIPNSVTSIGFCAFDRCSSLAEFNGKFASTDKRCLIVDGVLNSFAPYGLTEYKIPDSVTTIGSYVFYCCSSLKSITIGNSVTEIKMGAFLNCSSLSSVYCKPTTPPTLGGNTVFSDNASGRKIYVPSESVSAYKSAEYWSEYANSIVADPATEPASIPNNEIWYTSTDGNVVDPHAINVFGASIVSNTYSDGKGIIKFSGDVTTIGDQAFFYYCRNLKSITIPNSVTKIGIRAFGDCSSLTSITIPNSVTSIGQSAFFDCSGLTSITIPNSVTEIGKSAFAGCSSLAEFNGKFSSTDKRCLIVDSVIHSFAPYGLTNYTIPNSVTEIGDYAFYKCDNLTSITIPNSVTSIREYAFRGCSSLRSVSIGNSVTSIESSVFLDCSSLKSITIPNSVISIGICAFKGCSDLTSITIPNSVTSIGYGVFYGCSSLTEFEGKFATTDKRCLIVDGVLIAFAPFGLTEYTVQDGVTKIETNAFRDCSNLTRIVVPNSVTRIGGYTFYNCSSLTSITVSINVTSIGDYAFKNCSNLSSVYCKRTTPPSLGGSSVFDGNASDRRIYVPSSSVEAYKTANNWSEYADAIVAEGGSEPEPSVDLSVLFGDDSMVYVQGGTFTMGATAEQGDDALDREKPAHPVTVADFYIGKYEVTQAQWRAVMGSNPSNFKGDNYPVVVSWNDVQEFIAKLNTQTGKYFHLPTEAEWEYAARGGNKSEGYKYSGSNSIGDVAWYSDNATLKSHCVGEKQANELGIHDMSGNELEWCSDWYGSYSSSQQTNPTGPNSGSHRVRRGGHWNYGASSCRVSSRFNGDTNSTTSGFRLAMDK